MLDSDCLNYNFESVIFTAFHYKVKGVVFLDGRSHFIELVYLLVKVFLGERTFHFSFVFLGRKRVEHFLGGLAKVFDSLCDFIPFVIEG